MKETYKTILEDIIKNYNDAFMKRDAVFKGIDEAKAELWNINRSPYIKNADRELRLLEVNDRLSKLESQRTVIENEFKDYMATKRKYIKNKYTLPISSEDVDMKFMAMLDSDILSVNELVSFCDSFKNNATMQRIIAAKIKRIAEGVKDIQESVRLKAIATRIDNNINSTATKALKNFDYFNSFAVRAMECINPTGIEVGMNRELLKRLPDIISEAESIDVDIGSNA